MFVEAWLRKTFESLYTSSNDTDTSSNDNNTSNNNDNTTSNDNNSSSDNESTTSHDSNTSSDKENTRSNGDNTCRSSISLFPFPCESRSDTPLGRWQGEFVRR